MESRRLRLDQLDEFATEFFGDQAKARKVRFVRAVGPVVGLGFCCSKKVGKLGVAPVLRLHFGVKPFLKRRCHAPIVRINRTYRQADVRLSRSLCGLGSRNAA